MDVVYGYQTVNVEAQSAVPASLINWMRKLIAVRQGYRVFGRGTLGFVNPQNRKVLAYVRELDGETVLCVANLSRAPQQTELDLRRYRGRVPVEMIGWSAFGSIGDERYVVTLPGHGFFWFLLSETAQAPAWESAEPDRLPELLTLVLPRSLGDSRLGGSAVALLEREILPAYLPQQRWFADKGEAMGPVRLLDAARLGDDEPQLADPERAYLAIFELPEIGRAYFVPLAIDDAVDPAVATAMVRATLARVRRGPRDGLLFEGFATDELVLRFLDDVRDERRRTGYRGGTFAAHATDALRALPRAERPAVRRMNVEQSNTSVVIDEQIVLKGYRRTHAGAQPELETARFLDAAGYRNTPALLGYAEYEGAGAEPMAIAILQAFVSTQGDGWTATLAYLERFFDRRRTLERPQQLETPAVAGIENPTDVDEHAIFLERARTLGVRTAELHRAFATPLGDPAFEPEPTTRTDLDAWTEQARATAEAALAALARELTRVPPELREAAEALLARRDAIFARIAAPALDERVTKTRFHGDYHLGQVLVVADDFMIVDFEGEPGAAAGGAPPQVLAAARRRRDAALVQLRRGRRRARARRGPRRGHERLGAARARVGTAHRGGVPRGVPRDDRRLQRRIRRTMRRKRARCSTCSSWRRRSTRSRTSSRTARRGCASRWRGFVRSSTEAHVKADRPAARAPAETERFGELDRYLFGARDAPAFVREARRTSAAARRRRGRRVRGVGAEREQRRGRRRLQRLGRRGRSDAARADRRVGTVRRRRGARRSLQIRVARRARRAASAQGRSVRVRLRAPAGDGVGRCAPRDARVERRGMDRAPRRGERARCADRDLRSASRLVAPWTGEPLSDVCGARRTARPVRGLARLHAPRADAGDGASVRRIVGLSADGDVRADEPLRHAGRLRALRRSGASRGARRHRRLGARTLSERRARSRTLRRHRAVRACRSAARLSARLEYVRLRFRAQRSRELSARERAVLAERLSCRRAAGRRGRFDAVPRLQPRSRRVAAERTRRPREPRGDRVAASDQRGGVRGAARASRRSPRSRRRGRWSPVRSTPAGSASATSGTWAGCTTRSRTCAKIRSTVHTTRTR